MVSQARHGIQLETKFVVVLLSIRNFVNALAIIIGPIIIAGNIDTMCTRNQVYISCKPSQLS